MKTTAFTLVAAIALSGCATAPEQITPAYVSPAAYSGQTCSQLVANADELCLWQTKLKNLQDNLDDYVCLRGHKGFVCIDQRDDFRG